MINALLFDIGGVLIRTEHWEPRRKWERRFGLRDWQLQDLFFNSPVGQAAQVGQASTQDAWDYVTAKLSLRASELTELKRDFWSGDVLDRDLIALVQSLRPRYQTGVISNAMPDARETLRERINGETFDVLVFSGEEGVRKPDPAIYQCALSRLDTTANEAVFVDDVAENVEAALALGMSAIRFTSSTDLRMALVNLGIK